MCYLSAKYSSSEKPTQLLSRLQNIRHCLATSSVPRSLIISVTQVYSELTGIESGSFTASPSIGPLMSILSESFTAMSREELAYQLPALTTFFVKALDSRSMLSAQNASVDDMNVAEEPVVAALVSLVLKLSEASFRPLFFQLYDWATRSDVRKERLVSFYNVTMQIAEKLKGLFVAFAGHFIRNAAQVFFYFFLNLFIYLFTYLFTCLLTSLLTYLLFYLFTYLFILKLCYQVIELLYAASTN